ncbi:LPXTG cell wall anchor domain-containing protein [Streptomyces microflavus]|uniref:LPXTG cell wall anchor domain-containing protein n=1 Tax=Streptomyces microflavus TaxID=1919 RepID=UPI003647CFCF
MSITRRTLLTATAAGTLLAALWFVPSANATVETTSRSGAATTSAQGALSTAEDAASGPQLAETGPGTDTTPYLIVGTALLGLGAASVTYSVRRSGARPAL